MEKQHSIHPHCHHSSEQLLGIPLIHSLASCEERSLWPSTGCWDAKPTSSNLSLFHPPLWLAFPSFPRCMRAIFTLHTSEFRRWLPWY